MTMDSLRKCQTILSTTRNPTQDLLVVWRPPLLLQFQVRVKQEPFQDYNGICPFAPQPRICIAIGMHVCDSESSDAENLQGVRHAPELQICKSPGQTIGHILVVFIGREASGPRNPNLRVTKHMNFALGLGCSGPKNKITTDTSSVEDGEMGKMLVKTRDTPCR